MNKEQFFDLEQVSFSVGHLDNQRTKGIILIKLTSTGILKLEIIDTEAMDDRKITFTIKSTWVLLNLPNRFSKSLSLRLFNDFLKVCHCYFVVS